VTDPITPPLELVQQWRRTAPHPINEREHYHYITLCAAQWGADQELEACCKWLPKLPPWSANDLRKHRRPKPPSLKEQALEDLARIEATYGHLTWPETQLQSKRAATIRRALEALDD
jgi:hypothetical protein